MEQSPRSQSGVKRRAGKRAPGGPSDTDAENNDTSPPVEPADELGATRVISTDIGVQSSAAARSSTSTSLQGDDTVLPPVPQAELKELGEFRILQKLGEGAMGVVYRAFQPSFNREVALKILFPHVANNPKLRTRLEREGEVMFRLSHPSIVQSYAIDELEGRHFIAMEYVDGENLQKVLNRLGKLGVGDALYITLACARALKHAHDEGLIHRDIKPDNILVNSKGEVKVTDLGMVKLEDEDMSLTATGHAVGTPWYMPLEQARSAKDADLRCDIYALGCMLYCLLTGQPPFVGRTIVEVIQAKEVGTFPPARQRNTEVPERLDLIIFKMTQKLARNRYANCAEVIEALESLDLTNPRLSYLFSDTPTPRPSATRVRASATMEGAAPSAADRDLALRESEVKADVWYIRMSTASGKAMVRQLNSAEVIKLIGAKDFDPEATTASRNRSEGFRSLATYREFQNLVLARTARSNVDEKTVRYRNLYKKIEEQEKKREQEQSKPETDASNLNYWGGIFLRTAGYTALAAAGIYILFILLPKLLQN